MVADPDTFKKIYGKLVFELVHVMVPLREPWELTSP